MLNLNTVMINSHNPKKLSDFYSELLQGKPTWEGGEFIGFQAGNSYLMVGPHDKVNGKSSNPERLIINFETNDIVADFKRITSIDGAEVIQEPYNPSEDPKMQLATFADPDGNYFQLATPMG